MRLCVPILWLALASQALAQDKILIPDPPVATPAAGTPIVLTPDLIYLVQFDSPLIVLSSPEGVVSVSQLKGPRTWTGKFVDSPDKSQDRELAAKFIYRVQPLLTGRCELLVIPSGSTDAKAVVHRLIDAQIAPPSPVPPGPTPVPPGPTDPLQAQVQAAYDSDSDPAKAVNAPRLAFVFRDVARTIVTDPSVKTWGQFLPKLVAARKGIISDGLQNVRKVLDANLLANKFPTDANAPFEATLAKEQLVAAAKLLEGIK